MTLRRMLLFAMMSAALSGTADERFEKVLFPLILHNHPGAFGTVWFTEAVLRNEAPEAVEIFPSECYFRCRAGTYGCVFITCPGARATPPRTDYGGVVSARSGFVAIPGEIFYIQQPHARDVVARPSYAILPLDTTLAAGPCPYSDRPVHGWFEVLGDGKRHHESDAARNADFAPIEEEAPSTTVAAN